MCGGHSEAKSCADNPEEKELFEGMKDDIQTKAGKSYTNFEALKYTSQVVAGTNYWVKFHADDDYIHVKIFKPLPHTGNPAQIVEVQDGKTEEAGFDN